MSRARKWFIRGWKPALALLIVVLVAGHFYRILDRPELKRYPFALRIEYLLPAGLLYLAAHTCWAWFWVRLMRSQGVEVGFFEGLRAYFVSQLGKYIPGKVAVLAIRIALLNKDAGGKTLIVGVTATYETLCSMGAGALLGVLLLPWVGVMPREISDNIEFIFAIAALPVMLGVLNKLAARQIARMRGPDAPPLPSPPLLLLLQGLLHGAVGWCLLGISLGLAIQAVVVEPPAATLAMFLADLGAVSLSYVAGFFVLVAPGGLGVREVILQYALAPRFEPAPLATAQAAVIALVLRLTWTIAELLIILGLYSLGARSASKGNSMATAMLDEPAAESLDLPPEIVEGELLSLVIPVLNERESLEPLCAEISDVAIANRLKIEIVFVDDGSNDGSWKIIEKLSAADPRIHGIRFRRNFGKAAALAAGFKTATGKLVMTLDADLQDDPHEIPRFLAAIREGKDVISGWKKVRHDPWHKVWPSRLFNGMVGVVTGVWLHDHNCGMKAYRAEVFHEVRLYGELHRFIPVLAEARGFKIGELVINHRERKFGHSKYGFRRFAKGFLDLLTVKFLTGFGHRPQHLLGNFGLIPVGLGIIGMLFLGVNAIMRLASDHTVGASSTTQIVIAILSVGLLLFGAQLAIAGLIAELIVDRGPDDLDPFCVAERTS